MRLQILELPSVVVGEAVDTPFVIVVDSYSEETLIHEAARLMKDAFGARGVFLSPEPVEIVR